MGDKTKIEWTDATWNPIMGCTKVSEGCRNCYAERLAGRFTNSPAYVGLTKDGHWKGQIKETKKLLHPLHWRTPRRVFVNSMSDLFHERVTDWQRDRIFAVMACCPEHTFQVLTKRPARMLEYLRADRGGVWLDQWERLGIDKIASVTTILEGVLPNVWLGVSVENQATANERIPLLLATPAAHRFVSCEPLLGPVDLRSIPNSEGEGEGQRYLDPLARCAWETHADDYYDVCSIGQGLDWVICGGESGLGARPMHPDWVRGLRNQCQAAQVPFFFKQWGEWAIDHEAPNEEEWSEGHALVTSYHGDIRGSEALSDETTVSMWSAGKARAGATLDGREWREFPGVRP